MCLQTKSVVELGIQVFVRAVHEAKWMSEMEISIYDSWFDPVVSALPGLVPDGFIYLRASPDTCHKRMMLRKRAEEGGVSLKYLQDLHEKHESWLLPFESGNHGVLSVSKPSLHMDNTLHPDIKDRVFYLEGNHMHSSIQKVKLSHFCAKSLKIDFVLYWFIGFNRSLLWFWTVNPISISPTILKQRDSKFSVLLCHQNQLKFLI